jgi:aminoglycoside phosphotransferase family enzyme/predicted kinase
MSDPALAAHSPGSDPLRTLVGALRDPSRYPHPATSIEVVETHISFVVLAGDFAYKLKKPVDLGFLDFRTLATRRHFCEEELRLNRRTAPGLYLDVLPISGRSDAPVLGGDGAPIEYALKMRRFPQECLLDRMARAHALTPRHVDALAASVAAFHARVDRADAASAFGSPPQVLVPALQNFDQITALDGSAQDQGDIASLRAWTVLEHRRRSDFIEQRRREGFVRECHGDLHLGNIAVIDGSPVPFDCIEFNEQLRWIDVISEVAFLVMDLLDHRLPARAWRYLDAYLQATGDYGGVGLLRFFLVYRAMVRAKIALIRDCQAGAADLARHGPNSAFRTYLDLALGLSQSTHPAIVLMHGPSGSGKSTVAQTVLESLGAIRIRSDVERKRLHGLAPAERSASAVDSGLYVPAVSAATYGRLATLAAGIVRAGWPVLVDATFLRRADRESFRALARSEAIPFVIVSCEADEATLRARVVARERAAGDVSEAGLSVLERQLASREPLVADELADVITMTTDVGEAAMSARIETIARRVAHHGG